MRLLEWVKFNFYHLKVMKNKFNATKRVFLPHCGGRGKIPTLVFLINILGTIRIVLGGNMENI